MSTRSFVLARVTLDGDFIARIRVIEQPVVRERDGADSWRLVNSLQYPLVQAIERRSGIAARGGIDRHHRQAIRTVSEIEMNRVLQATNKQAGANRQQQRDGDLADNQNFSLRQAGLEGRLKRILDLVP